MLTTAMNLLPIGQLDGGHILYSFFPRRHKLVSIAGVRAMPDPAGRFLVRLVLSGASALLIWAGGILRFTTPPIWARGGASWRWIALVVFLLCFTYAPIADRRASKSRE